MSKSYPFTAWVLTKDFIPKQIELVRPGNYSGVQNGRHATAGGRTYLEPELHQSKRAVIALGWRRIEAIEKAEKERALRIAKQKQNLTEHSADL